MIVWNVSPLFRGSWKPSPIHSVGRQTRDVWNGGPSLMREGNGSTPSPAHILCVKPNYLHIKWKTKSLIENQKT